MYPKDTYSSSSPVIQAIGRTTHIRFHFHQVSVSTRSSLAAATPHWVPPIDLYETENELVLEVCLAGVPTEDVHLQITARRALLSGTRNNTTNAGIRSYFVMEIERGRFSRSIDLPFPVEPQSVQATYAAGLLTVRVCKRSGSMHGCRKANSREGLE